MYGVNLKDLVSFTRCRDKDTCVLPIGASVFEIHRRQFPRVIPKYGIPLNTLKSEFQFPPLAKVGYSPFSSGVVNVCKQTMTHFSLQGHTREASLPAPLRRGL